MRIEFQQFQARQSGRLRAEHVRTGAFCIRFSKIGKPSAAAILFSGRHSVPILFEILIEFVMTGKHLKHVWNGPRAAIGISDVKPKDIQITEKEFDCFDQLLIRVLREQPYASP